MIIDQKMIQKCEETMSLINSLYDGRMIKKRHKKVTSSGGMMERIKNLDVKSPERKELSFVALEKHETSETFPTIRLIHDDYFHLIKLQTPLSQVQTEITVVQCASYCVLSV